MTREEITNKLKEYCNYEMDSVERHGYDPHNAVTRCYGATMFVLNFLDSFDDSLAKWWDDEMLPKFRELERG